MAACSYVLAKSKPMSLYNNAPSLLILCPTHRDLRELGRISSGQHKFLTHQYASLDLEAMMAPNRPDSLPLARVEQEIATILRAHSGSKLNGVISTDDYPGTTLAAIVADRLGLPGPSPRSTLLAQHKHVCRQLQMQVVPEAVPRFQAIEPRWIPGETLLPFPFFAKPVKSFFSAAARSVHGPNDLERVFKDFPPQEFFVPFRDLVHRYLPDAVDGPSKLRYLLIESLLRGEQVTLDGYVAAGQIHTLGIVDSIFFPGTTAFQRFQYPSRLPEAVSRRLRSVAHQVIQALEYDNSMFNIEFIYNREDNSVHIIEINPRMSSQFADLFEKVDGINTYSVLLDVALGKVPQVFKRAGPYKLAASCVLRRFEDAFVQALPRFEEVEEVLAMDPDVRVEILAENGKNLSEQMQDACSYRYGILNIGGSDEDDILRKCDLYSSRLTFQFRPPTRSSVTTQSLSTEEA